TAPYTLSLHDALPICFEHGEDGAFHQVGSRSRRGRGAQRPATRGASDHAHWLARLASLCQKGPEVRAQRSVLRRSQLGILGQDRSEEHTSELQSLAYL